MAVVYLPICLSSAKPQNVPFVFVFTKGLVEVTGLEPAAS